MQHTLTSSYQEEEVYAAVKQMPQQGTESRGNESVTFSALLGHHWRLGYESQS